MYSITCTNLKKVTSNVFIHLIVCLFWTSSFVPSFGQKYEIGAGMGGAAYSGDLIRMIDPLQTDLQGTLFGKKNFDNVWTLRVGLSLAKLESSDEIKPIDIVSQQRNAIFKGGVVEFAATMEFNFLDFLRNDPEFRFSPYAFFGLGYSQFFLKGGNDSDPDPPKEKSYQLSTPLIPFGGGVKYRLDNRWTLSAEIGFRPTMTDYLDKIDSRSPAIPRYMPQPDATTGIIPPYGINFGNPYTKDWYYFAGLTLSYTIFDTKCFAY